MVVAGGSEAQAQTCQLDTNPSCGAAVNLGTFAGDAGTPTVTRTGTGEAFFKVRLREDASSTRDLTASVRLQSPPGIDYDLLVRCASCTSTPQTSNAGAGAAEEVRVLRRDNFSDNSFDLFVEVRFRVGTSCSPWTLTIATNVAPGSSPLVCG